MKNLSTLITFIIAAVLGYFVSGYMQPPQKTFIFGAKEGSAVAVDNEPQSAWVTFIGVPDHISYIENTENKRAIGEMKMSEFVSNWQEGKTKMKKSSPNVALTYNFTDYGFLDSFVAMSEPSYDPETEIFRFKAKMLSFDKSAMEQLNATKESSSAKLEKVTVSISTVS